MDGIHDRLWNTEVDQATVLEQYKLYVEMADRVSARRATANTFFLTLNTSVLTVLGVYWSTHPGVTPWWLAFPVAALLLECVGWFYLVRSYRQLNKAKFRVIGALEEKLSASPFWRAEWYELGEGRDRSRYWPLTHLEQWVPILFGAIYAVGFGTAVLV